MSQVRIIPIDEYLPVFMYGTLRNGLRNYPHYLKGRTVKEMPATIAGRIHFAGGYSFPCLVQGGGLVVGELMYINPKMYDLTMKRLDSLEQNGFMYNREKALVNTEKGQVKAWTYYWLDNRVGKLIEHGDFKRAMQELQGSW